jgi:hypothetical protein
VSDTPKPVACPHCGQPIGAAAEAEVAIKALRVIDERERFLIEGCDLSQGNARVRDLRCVASGIEQAFGVEHFEAPGQPSKTA